MAFAGPYYAIFGVISLGRTVVSELLTPGFLYMGHVRTLNTLLLLKECVDKLGTWYRETSFTSTPNRHFPRIRSYTTASNETITLEYFKTLTSTSTPRRLPAYMAGSSLGRDVVVKFVKEGYGEAVHRPLAKHGLAPTLHYISPQPVTYEGLFMVVMDIGGHYDADTRFTGRELPTKVRDAVRRAVEIMHQEGFVFGDLRRPNIMLSADGGVKLVDFDWAGKEGEARYPHDLNMAIEWAPGVTDGGIISEAHDLYMLDHL